MSHLCECGCGQETRPYVKTNTAHGRVKGEYARYVQGHYRKHPRPAPALDPVQQPRMTPDEVLDEWVWLGGPTGAIRFDVFAGRIGLTYAGLSALFLRAKGDPRAVRHVSDEPVRHWRAS